MRLRVIEDGGRSCVRRRNNLDEERLGNLGYVSWERERGRGEVVYINFLHIPGGKCSSLCNSK